MNKKTIVLNCSPALKRKRNVLSVGDKLDAVNRLLKGETPNKLAAEFNVGTSTISDWKKNRVKLEQQARSLTAPELKKIKTIKSSYYEDLDEVLFIWFCQQRNLGMPISGPMIQSKAQEFFKKMYGEDAKFSASNGWLQGFKNRHGIRQLSIAGEKLSADLESAQNYISKFAELVSGYSPQQIFNADETGLWFKSLPEKSLASKEEKAAPGFKMCKQRLTIMGCANAAGNFKLPLMVIGTAAKPHALKGYNMSALPVFYRKQKKGWMNGALFREWFHDQFVPKVSNFCRDNNLPVKAILFVDNAPSHPAASELISGDIKVEFLPPNTTSVLQPMDQQVLQTLKRGYRKKLLTRLVEEQRNLTIPEKLKEVNVKNVIYWVSDAWDEVSVGVLQKSWKNIWPDFSMESTQNDDEPERELNNIKQLINEIPGCEGDTVEDANEWLAPKIERDHCYTDEEILKLVSGENDSSDESEDEDKGAKTKITHSAAASAFETALEYIEQHPNSSSHDIWFIRKWLEIAATARGKGKQLQLERFFKARD